MTSKKPAAAGRKTVAKSTAAPRVIDGVSLIRLPMERNKPSHPAALYQGEAPQPREVIEFTLENGVTYQGEVAEAIEVNGEVMVEFARSLKAVTKK